MTPKEIREQVKQWENTLSLDGDLSPPGDEPDDDLGLYQKRLEVACKIIKQMLPGYGLQQTIEGVRKYHNYRTLSFKFNSDGAEIHNIELDRICDE